MAGSDEFCGGVGEGLSIGGVAIGRIFDFFLGSVR